MILRIKLLFISLLICNSIFSQSFDELQLLYTQKKFTTLLNKCKEILVTDPNNPFANHLIGRTYTDTRKFKDAIPFLQKAKHQYNTTNWVKAWSNAYLGICYFATDDFFRSKFYFNLAITLDASENATTFAQEKMEQFQLIPFFNKWKTIELKSIRFHFQPNHNINDVGNYCSQREEAYHKINTFFNATPSKKIDYYIWNKPQIAVKTLGKPLNFALPKLCLINSKIDQNKGHEITHVLCDFGLHPTIKNRLINEGVAVAFDQTNQNRIERAKTVYKNYFTIKTLMENADNYSESIIYPIGGAFIDFLKEKGGSEKLKNLLIKQSWENLVSLYGLSTVLEFEHLLKS